MTDKEIAEGYARENKIIISCDCNYYNSAEDLEEAFLAGLKAGKQEKWHDLRKNPYDLPTEIGEYWCKWDDGTYCTVHYFGECFGDYVIAWCEIPKFEE